MLTRTLQLHLTQKSSCLISSAFINGLLDFGESIQLDPHGVAAKRRLLFGESLVCVELLDAEILVLT